ncbi:hypothetical protein IP87_07505 [beta proteobacterium AAP121]|nr:hypothetical protein IP80_08165 [beta proteobacterium AAP65]KPF98757.1 hypothetical protein IP87_07505 [beta proteobacterium AAP121]
MPSAPGSGDKATAAGPAASAAKAAPAPAAPAVAAAPAPARAASAPGTTSASAPRLTLPGGLGTPPGGPAGGPPPFATVIKDARRIDGPLVLWQKDDKVWIELLPTQLGKPFLLSPKIKSGIGQAFVLGGLMALPFNGIGGAQVVEFVRVHNQVRLQARNTEVLAAAGTPEARAVADSYSNSLLASVPVISQPHPDRKSVLVEANAIFLGDMVGIGAMLQRGLRQGYGLDRGNTVITAARGSAVATTLETQAHYFTGGVSSSPQGLMPGMPVPQIPRHLPDARSMLIGLSYSLAPLPEAPMKTRRADPRVGLFTTTVLDFSDELARTPRQRFVTRWRLEKKEPEAALSDPVKPITFWIDRNVPLAWRETTRAAILEWNKAFEKIGFRNAIKVEQQPDDAKFDTLDYGYASVRWMMNAEPAFGAIGPSHIDPRTGEILDADIAFEGLTTRGIRGLRSQVLGPPRAQAAATEAGAAQGLAAGHSFARIFEPPAALADSGVLPPELARCTHGEFMAEQVGYAMSVLEARGELEPDSPVAQQFVQDYVKEALMHEVGHALGLRHNFRASRAYTEAQLADAEFTRAYGTTGSVMEYNAVNLPRPGQSGGMPFQTTLGPYDYWAVEFAYKTLPAGAKPEEEKAELQRIAERSKDPLLAFGTDEDVLFGLDPEIIQGDLGADPLAFAAKRLEIARDLFKRQETRELPADRDYAVLRRSLNYALNDVARSLGVLARQLGGVRTLRDFPGSGREPLQPVSGPVQRQSLELMSKAALSAEGLSLTPALQRRLAPDFLDRAELIGDAGDFVLPQRLLGLQMAVLSFLMSDGLAARVQDSATKFDKPSEALQLSELYQRLSDDVWSELGAGGIKGGVIRPERRELQRGHVNRLAAALLRLTPQTRADARGLTRLHAKRLLTRLETAQGRGVRADSDTAVHIADSIDTLRQALAAPMLRLGL